LVLVGFLWFRSEKFMQVSKIGSIVAGSGVILGCSKKVSSLQSDAD
jgi:hypothetical protein